MARLINKEIIKEMVTKSTFILIIQKERSKISSTHNEERELRKLISHRVYRRQEIYENTTGGEGYKDNRITDDKLGKARNALKGHGDRKL